MKQYPADSLNQYLQYAYAFFNKKLFEDRLPTDTVITLQRKKNVRGFFRSSSFYNTERVDLDSVSTEDLKNNFCCEVALNPESFNRPSEATYSTLCHELTHLEQWVYGTPSRNGYHNAEWVELMERIGLIPSNTGMPGGRKTGQRMTHYVEKGGRYQKAYKQLAASGYYILWAAVPYSPKSNSKSTGKRAEGTRAALAREKQSSKTKYSCGCGLNAWAKPEAKLICGECHESMEAC